LQRIDDPTVLRGFEILFDSEDAIPEYDPNDCISLSLRAMQDMEGVFSKIKSKDRIIKKQILLEKDAQMRIARIKEERDIRYIYSVGAEKEWDFDFGQDDPPPLAPPGKSEFMAYMGYDKPVKGRETATRKRMVEMAKQMDADYEADYARLLAKGAEDEAPVSTVPAAAFTAPATPVTSLSGTSSSSSLKSAYSGGLSSTGAGYKRPAYMEGIDDDEDDGDEEGEGKKEGGLGGLGLGELGDDDEDL